MSLIRRLLDLQSCCWGARGPQPRLEIGRVSSSVLREGASMCGQCFSVGTAARKSACSHNISRSRPRLLSVCELAVGVGVWTAF